MTLTAFTLVLIHKHRMIVFRRIFLMVGMLYFYRGITMYITVLPKPDTTYYCSPKLNHSITFIDSPRNWIIFHGIALCALVTGVVFLLLGRGHYSIDVFIAYWVTSRYSVPTKHEDLKTSK
ncbi:phosphatidylcholine:ceramide cholinephosphotransferase 2 [Eurytemora carolleeae]|uniref:phosphatidylcholine:ceramide cholinephosphotransferase 2 n=1 Tax=Eurytemora carolleeae TaxID=1294199 RepID=UPI000C7837F3|nr:phosphatidylcholine:ceramide cholinephosphotransferase 2 [Eurytemora carolleeae]|eukprot:XP_023323244.1 phosphatidylcholine:ceramide cholinephosphotransferase 2-like [Eurytemora affinis]